ncbi:MAG: alpha-1,2-fucosyltransferase [Luteolibacter sp.]
MIRVLMLGRLGNNLFQYALGRVLAERHGVPLVMDGSWFNGEGWAQVNCIRRLPIKATIARPFSLGSRALLKLTGKHHWEYLGKPEFREKSGDHSFDASFLHAPADCFIFGYFQTPLYFNNIEETLRAEINPASAFREPPPAALCKQLGACGSVGVHVRRQDFTHLPIFDVCDSAYYQNSMNQLRARLPVARFFIFSDDPEWCKNHFTKDDETVVDLPQSAVDPLMDLHLMSLANHHIIANSTYSWWAAWIGKKAGQIVICPPRWFNAGFTAPIEEKLCDGWEIFNPSATSL